MNAQTTTYSAVLGVILASLRKEFGKEQNDIAQKMGLSQASYSRLESGKATFSVDQMYQASLALGVPDFDLMSRMNNMVGQLRRNGVEVQPHIRACLAGNKPHPVSQNPNLSSLFWVHDKRSAVFIMPDHGPVHSRATLPH